MRINTYGTIIDPVIILNKSEDSGEMSFMMRMITLFSNFGEKANIISFY